MLGFSIYSDIKHVAFEIITTKIIVDTILVISKGVIIIILFIIFSLCYFYIYNNTIITDEVLFSKIDVFMPLPLFSSRSFAASYWF